MKTIYIDDSNLVVLDVSTNSLLYSVSFLGFSFTQQNDSVLIQDERNDFIVKYDDAQDEEGNTFSDIAEFCLYLKAIKEEPLKVGNRLQIGNTLLSNTGGGLVMEDVLGDATLSSYVGMQERNNSAGDVELVVKRRHITVGITEDVTNAYQSIFTDSKAGTVDYQGRYQVIVDIYAPDDTYTND